MGVGSYQVIQPAGPSTFFAGWPTFSAIPWMLLCARCVRAEEEKTVIGVQPVRARCGYRLCLTQRQATNPNNDASHLDLAAAASTPCSSQAAYGQHQQQQA